MSTDETESKPELKLANIELKSSDAKEVVVPDSEKLQQALASNPDQFPSMADLAIPGRENIEPFQIVEDGKTIAATRKVEQAGSKTFHDGLEALGSNASEEEKAHYQIEYIERKAGSNDSTMLIKTGIQNSEELGWYEAGQAVAQLPLSLQLSIIGNALLSGAGQFSYEHHERSAGSVIGAVQGMGSFAFNLATIADFSAYCILGDKRALEMGEKYGEAVGKTLVSGIRLFQAADKYLYDIGFNGDYSKPFNDVITVGMALNQQFNQLPPREQERLKSELISQVVADGFLGYAGAQSLNKAKTYLEILDAIALKAIENSRRNIDNLHRTIDTIKNQTKLLLSPQLEIAGVGKIRMRDLPKVTREDLALRMEGKPKSNAYRGDNNFHSKLDEYGRPKSHIDEHGDLVPADLNGVYEGKQVEVIDHVFGFSDTDVKQYSPYTSFSLESGIAVKYGNQKIVLDLDSFRKAIKQGEILGAEIIEHEELIDIVNKSNYSDFNKWKALKFITEDKEILIKGTIPARFLETGK